MVTQEIPFSRFCKLAGTELAQEADQLLQRADIMAVVLYADVAGGRCPIVPVGAGEKYTTLDAVPKQEVDGLLPCCATRKEDRLAGEEKARVRQDREVREAALAERERLFALQEGRIAELEARVNTAVRAITQR